MSAVGQLLISLIQLYSWVLIARILLSWFPNVKPWEPPFRQLIAITDPVLKPFRQLIPPIMGIDFSPMVPFLLIDYLIIPIIRVAL